MPNHLIKENSPYLLQHAENPVDWYPWNEEALEKAKREDKPIFLSIGYAACHWCHVMAHESFEEPEIASIMNANFVNIKVDREERPDLDSIYMQAVVAITHQGGWPMSVFLTPKGKPFYGGTYFPSTARYNLPSFKEILLNIAKLWKEDRNQLLENSENVSQVLQQQTALRYEEDILDPDNLKKATSSLKGTYDWNNGGWGQAPKFPQPNSIEYLLRISTRMNEAPIEIAIHALRAMAKGGMYDVVGGGFARYSVDNRWLIPHFEKMLYDNAQLATTYLHAFLLTGEEEFQDVVEKTLDFILREMTDKQGGFYSSLDADSEGKEGKYYGWTLQEIQDAFQNSQDIELILATYGITEKGNFDGTNILQRVLDDNQIAEEFGIPTKQVPEKMTELHDKLLKFRFQRVRPETDDKVLVSWNSLMMIAFAEAGRYLNREDYIETAKRNADFLLNNLTQGNRLLRSWRKDQAKHNAYLEDYAGLILGLLALYQADPNLRWYIEALKLADEMIAHFTDSSGGFYDTRDDHEYLLLRPKDLRDNATPSGNALAATALLLLSAYENKIKWRNMAEKMIVSMQNVMTKYPTTFSQWLIAADLAIGSTSEIAILGSFNDPQTKSLTAILQETYLPRTIVAISEYPPADGSPKLLEDRLLRNGQPTAYVCHDFACLKPVNSSEDLREQLNNSHQKDN